jgi:hypothetical protein
MKKMRLFTPLLAALWALVGSSPAAAAIISFVPDAQSVALGSQAHVNVVVSDLGDGGPPSLGSYDVDFSYDATILDAASVSFDIFLGGPGGSFPLSDLTTPGAVALSETSFLSEAELDALQSDSFRIAEIWFDTLDVGISDLTFTLTDLFDATLTADPIPVTQVVDGSIEVTAAPEPGSVALLSTSLGFLTWRRRRRRRA